MRLVKVGLVLLVIGNCVLAATIRVPQDQPTIQAGINAAVDGDTVLVSSGTYLENLDFLQKSIVLTTEAGFDSTFLESATPMTSLILCSGSIDSTSEVSGFTFQNSNATHVIPAINGSRIRIQHNRFRYLVGSQTLIFCHNSNLRIERNLFVSNVVGNACIGVYEDNSAAEIINNTFSDNSRGFYCLSGQAVAKNNIVVGSTQYGVFGDFAVLSYNDIWNNGANYDGGAMPGVGDISADPLFFASPSGDYSLSSESPCINAGDPDPAFNDPDGTRNDIGALPFRQGVVVDSAFLDNEPDFLHVLGHVPILRWICTVPGGLPQTAFEIAVGTDNDWQYAEMWNPAPVASADTFVVYGGAPLIDGQTYWLRLRVSNSLGWSNWAELMFRMNSVPSTPELVAPANGGIVTSPQPSLAIRRVSDAEGDSLLLTFEVTNDSSFAFFVPFTAQPGSDSLTTVNVPFYLTEDQHYWWRVKASDYYEESAYSTIWSFWLNSENIAPTPFELRSPPDGLTPALTTTTPILQWTRSRDFDPFDSVRYELHVALYPNFSFATIIAGITDTTYQIGEPLSWGTNYWWKVKATDLSTGVTWSDQVYSFRVMKIGDPDGNGFVTISDAVFLINYIFAGGPAPVPLLSGDADCSGAISISDAVYLINYIFVAGPAPCEP